jgi:uncharacterized membrane protein
MQENSVLRELARNQLKGGWLAAVGVTFVAFAVLMLSGVVGIGPIVLGGPVSLGLYGYFIRKVRGEPAKLENLFDGFKQFLSSFLLYLVQSIFIALWTCLLIVPGIVKSLSYSMAFFILRDNPDIGALEAITASRKMMDGYKTKLFYLYLSFIGWALLCVITAGIGYLWLVPYINLSVVNFYEDLKKNQSNSPAAENS